MKLTEHEKKQLQQPPLPVSKIKLTYEEKLWHLALVESAIERMGKAKYVAEAIGVHRAHVSRWRHAVRPIPEKYYKPLADIIDGAADVSRKVAKKHSEGKA